MTVFYDQLTPLRTVFRWTGSTFKLTFGENKDVPIFIVAHFLILIVHYYIVDLGSEFQSSLEDALATSGFMLIFLLVFYNGQCYTRYLRFVSLAWKSWSRGMDITVQAKAYLPEGDPDVIRVVRYAQAAHHLCFMQLSGKVNWETVRRRKLLSEGEIKILTNENFAGSKYLLVFGWVCQILHQRVRRHGLDPHMFQAMEKVIFEMRGALGEIYDVDDNPIPYPYFHLLNSLIYLYIPMFIYCWSMKPLGSVAILVLVPCLIGLREVSTRLANPFGADDVDLPIPELLLRNLIIAKAICCNHHFQTPMDDTHFEDMTNECDEMREFANYSLNLVCNIDSELRADYPTHHNVKKKRAIEVNQWVIEKWGNILGTRRRNSKIELIPISEVEDAKSKSPLKRAQSTEDLRGILQNTSFPLAHHLPKHYDKNASYMDDFVPRDDTRTDHYDRHYDRHYGRHYDHHDHYEDPHDHHHYSHYSQHNHYRGHGRESDYLETDPEGDDSGHEFYHMLPFGDLNLMSRFWRDDSPPRSPPKFEEFR